MPKTKGQGLVFGILMSVTMAYGMEVYNVALKEASFMWLFVFLFSNLWGNRLYMNATAERSTGENCRPYDYTDQ